MAAKIRKHLGFKAILEVYSKRFFYKFEEDFFDK